MNNIVCKITLVALLLCVGSVLYAQKNEIKAFEKQNKDMLKQLKKQYKTNPEVKLSDQGFFYIELKKKESKQGPDKFFLIDETGTPLYPLWLDNYKIIKGGYFYVGQNFGSTLKWGAIDIKGKQILPISYDQIRQSVALEAGTFKESSVTYWHPASKGFWLASDNTNGHHVFYSLDGQSILHEYDGVLKSQLSYFWTIAPSDMAATGNQKGLLTYDGDVIFEQEYNSFYIETSGLVNCIKREADGRQLYGGKMLNSAISDIVVPPLFNDVTYWSTSESIKCKIHRDDDYETYDPAKNYVIVFNDEGERLYDQGKYQDVIKYYEGEGYGAVHGDYYMGLSAEKIAKAEMGKMNNVINTLNSDKNYYLPITKPENYTFDAGTISGMYTSAGVYLEKFLNNDKVDPNDSKLAKARKLRGEIITARNNVTKKIEEYGTALQKATAKNIERERVAAEQKALQAQQAAESQRAANQLATGLTNLIFGGGKK